jgi:23S rRNA pseudouridine2605 synthase
MLPVREDKINGRLGHAAGRPSARGEARPKEPSAAERIAKVMARAGLCSRREAETWIAEGRVAVNGKTVTSPAVNVMPADEITVDGKPLAGRPRTRLFLFHKPRGLVTTARDPQGRPTIFDYIRGHWPDVPRVVSVGRLDINSEGLLLLTNDGGLARVLELPSTGWIRRYRVRAHGETTQASLDRLKDGVTIEGVRYAPVEAALDRVQGANCWLTMALREGKNREIKRVLEHLGLRVNRLIRLSFGPFQLGDIAEGEVKEVPARVLRDQLGATLAKAAGVDFSAPLRAKREAPRAAMAGAAEHEAGFTRHARMQGKDRFIPHPETRAAAPGKPAPRSRKHISALRAESEKPGEPRKRIERGSTADRAGRTIKIERLVATASAPEKKGKKQARKSAKSYRFADGGAPAIKRQRKEAGKRLASGSRPRPSPSGGAPGGRSGGRQKNRGKS